MQNTPHQPLIKIIPIAQDTAVQNFTLMQNTLYSHCPRHNSAELYFNGKYTLFQLSKTKQCRTLLLWKKQNTLYFYCPRHSSAELYFYAKHALLQLSKTQCRTSLSCHLLYCAVQMIYSVQWRSADQCLGFYNYGIVQSRAVAECLVIYV